MTSRTLTFIGGPPVYNGQGAAYVHRSTGRLLWELKKRFSRITLCTAADTVRRDDQDFRIPLDIDVLVTPPFSSSQQALWRLRSIRRVCSEAVLRSNSLLIRGMFPGIGAIYAAALQAGIRPVHWLVGDPIGLLKSHNRDGWLKDRLGMWYSKWWRRTALRGCLRSGGEFICNGEEIARQYRKAPCHVVVSSSTCADDFYCREDTCCQSPIRVCSICYVRPEKGLEFLIQAVGRLRHRSLELIIVGARDRYPDYQAFLDNEVARNQLQNIVHFVGHADATEMRSRLVAADVFVLPTLSEGTPRVLVDSRACGVPTIATRVGGIPGSVSDGIDGVLVPPRDAQSLADAIERIIEDRAFRRSLILNGYERVKQYTIDRFANHIADIIFRVSTTARR